MVAAFLGGLVALTGLAFCPLPAWWVLTPARTATPARTPETTVVLAESLHPAAEEGAAPVVEVPTAGDIQGSWSPTVLLQLWRELAREKPAAPDPSWRWPGIAALLFLTGVSLSLLRFVVALWAVHDCRRRSRRIDDPLLNGLADSLRAALNCARPVELREAADLATAATVGWCRPLVLLPPEWRTWSESELRAVLAHELAHVSRADYLTGLVARISVALHFYHPLVYWLVGRMQLQQELAADAVGARCAGGRDLYLRMLARMALRQAGRPCGWPARTFLPTPRTLMRRIRMLKAKDGTADRKLSRTGRALLTTALLCVAVGVSAVRSPAQKPGDDGPEKVAAREYQVPLQTDDRLYVVAFTDAGTVAEPVPFDLSYLPPDAQGAWAIRPPALFGRPDLKKQTAQLNELVGAFSKAGLNLPPELILPLEGFEQLTGSVIVKTDKDSKGPQSAMLLQVSMMRAVKEFDWKKQFLTMMPKAVEVECAGKVYYRVPKESVPEPLVGMLLAETKPCFFIPDGRTIVFNSEDNVRRLIEGKYPQLQRPWAADWKRVERGLVATAFADRDVFRDRKQPEKDVDAAIVAFMQTCTSLVYGIDCQGQEIVFQCIARCETEKDAEAGVKAFKEMLVLGGKSFDEPAKGPEADAVGDLSRIGKELVKRSRVERAQTAVTWRSEIKCGPAEILANVPFFNKSTEK